MQVCGQRMGTHVYTPLGCIFSTLVRCSMLNVKYGKQRAVYIRVTGTGTGTIQLYTVQVYTEGTSIYTSRCTCKHTYTTYEGRDEAMHLRGNFILDH